MKKLRKDALVSALGLGRKLVLLVALLACTASAQNTVSSIGELSQRKTYTIYNPHFTAYAIYSPSNNQTNVWAAGMTGDAGHAVKNKSYSEPFDATSPQGAWMFVSYEEEWYIYNVGAQKFLNVGTTGGTQATRLLDTPTPVSITELEGGFAFLTTEGVRNYMCAAPQLDYPISVWSTDDAGSLWEIAENDNVPEDYETCIAILEERVPRMAKMTIITRNGNIYPKTNGGGFGDKIVLGQSFTFSAQGMNGYSCPDSVVIRHGKNLDGSQYVDGQRQWGEYRVEAKKALTTVPADSVDGDIRITALWERSSDLADVLVFSDEFDGEGEPTADKWQRTPRRNATWNRWCSDSPLVVYEKDGSLHCLAIPNPDTAGDNVPMITGGIKSEGRFDFRYGHVEARIKTNQWKGNFPAFWMMPAKTVNGWPNDGEIDIWETIDNSTQSWHTIHTNWTYNLHQGTNSQTKSNLDYDCWHTFAMDWNEKAITWYVDGVLVWSYTKSTDSNALNNGQWPFDAPFYLILNQSVGNGSWAANADTNHTYETQFDWVRVYQPVSITAIDDVVSEYSATTKVSRGKPNTYYDLQGRVVESPTNGIYIYNDKKVLR
ncbi:MAG: glycoside hydrolase family 16 protein [Prevotellaceae bacterium]|nr:glycoside hydrolase family 16 protein [Prevotellaceae bacterium]